MLDDIFQIRVAGFDPYRASDRYNFDPIAAEKPIRFCETNLKHVKGFSGPLLLSDFHKRITRNIYGWRHKETGRRRFRNVFLFTPRKNAKSTYASFLAIWEFLFTGEIGPEVAIAATDRDQAGLIFDIVEGFCLKNPALKKRVQLLPSRKRIVSKASKGYLHAMASDAGSAHGLNLSALFIDELHAFPDRDFFDVLKTSQVSRQNPLCVMTTTAGFGGLSICKEEYDYAKDVRDGLIDDPRYLPVICEADEKDDWADPVTHKKANPLYGISFESDAIEEHCRKAKNQRTYVNTFKRLYLNLWTSAESVFITPEDWTACNGEEPANLCDIESFGGLDLSAVLDLTSFGLVFPWERNYIFKSWNWIPEDSDTLKDKKMRRFYEKWAEDPRVNLEIIPGRMIDYDLVAERILALGTQYNINSIAYDSWHHSQTVKVLKSEGVKCVKWGQGYYSISQATKDLEAYAVQARINNLSDPLLAWCINNATVKPDLAGNLKVVKPDRKKSSKKVDPVVALIMALGLAQVTKGAIELSF